MPVQVGVLQRIVGMPWRIGGETHSGWLPPGVARPLPIPIYEVVLDLKIEFDGSGYLFCYRAREGSFCGDTWYPSLEDAEQDARESFGIDPSRWVRIRAVQG